MKRSIWFVLLALFTFSCTGEVQETLTDNRDAFIDKLAQSDEYHNYFTALRETQTEEAADPLDRQTATELYEKGIDIRTLAEADIAHIPGAITYVRTHTRLMRVIKELNARFPTYPRQVSFEDRGEILNRYMAHRGVAPMDFVSPNQISSLK